MTPTTKHVQRTIDFVTAYYQGREVKVVDVFDDKAIITTPVIEHYELVVNKKDLLPLVGV